MSETAELLSRYVDALRSMGTDPEPLAGQAEALVGVPDAELEPAISAFHAAADRCPSAPTEDADYGALLLEALGDGCTDPRRKAALYDHASRRAAAFAAGATSGGEGLARMLDVDRLAKKRAEPGHAGDPVPRPAGSNSPRTQE